MAVRLRAMKLTETQKKYLRGLGHQLNPVIMVGDAGLSDSLLAEYDSTLAHHELIKVSLRVGDRETRDAMISDLVNRSDASLVQRVGNVALIYCENPEKKRIKLPR